MKRLKTIKTVIQKTLTDSEIGATDSLLLTKLFDPSRKDNLSLRESRKRFKLIEKTKHELERRLRVAECAYTSAMIDVVERGGTLR